jgi:Ca2+/Na+ antiporter
MEPEYGSQYSVIRALLSNSYIRHYYAKEVSEVPVLNGMEQTVIDALISNEIAKVHTFKVNVLVVIFIFAAYIYASWNLNVIAAGVGAILVIGTEVLILNMSRRRNRQQDAADQFFFAVSALARNEACWQDSKFRWAIAADVERIAHNVERIPLALSGVAPSVRRECLMMSGARAQALRELELLTIRPGPSAYTDLLKQLVAGLLIMSEGRWYDLPEAQYERQVSWRVRAFQIGVAFIAFAGAITLLSFIPKLGVAASVSATALVAIAVAFANVAGMPIDRIEKYAQVGSDVVAPKK